MRHPRRQKMTIGTYPKHILLRVKPDTFHRLHLRATENNRSLNLECNEILRTALKNENAPESVA